MTTIGRLFGRSPFGSLQRHMEQVARCVAKMGESLDAFERGEWDKLESFAKEVSSLEHDADIVKDDIRTRLRRKFFFNVDRNRLLDVLSTQDALADVAEDVCVILTYKRLPTPDAVRETFQRFRDLNIEAFLQVECITRELDELVESGFGGAEAERVRKMVHDVAVAEHRVDMVQHELTRLFCTTSWAESPVDFYLWMRLINELADISNLSENLANRIEAMLELK